MFGVFLITIFEFDFGFFPLLFQCLQFRFLCYIMFWFSVKLASPVFLRFMFSMSSSLCVWLVSFCSFLQMLSLVLYFLPCDCLDYLSLVSLADFTSLTLLVHTHATLLIGLFRWLAMKIK